MKISDRAKEVLKWEKVTNKTLEEKTGISRDTWSAMRNGRIRINEDHLEAINNLWPKYSYWIMTGEELPEAGQISPMTEQIRLDSIKEGRA